MEWTLLLLDFYRMGICENHHISFCVESSLGFKACQKDEQGSIFGYPAVGFTQRVYLPATCQTLQHH
jgi:hypothetical protein